MTVFCTVQVDRRRVFISIHIKAFVIKTKDLQLLQAINCGMNILSKSLLEYAFHLFVGRFYGIYLSNSNDTERIPSAVKVFGYMHVE